MSVNNNSAPIYNLDISFLEDIERELDNHPQAKQKVSEIIKNKHPYGVEKIANSLDLDDVFKKAYWGSLNFSACADILRTMESYKILLDHSIAVCNETITPLFIRSFKCHQKAINYQVSGQEESAIAAMDETGEVAKSIASECNKLSKKFNLLREKGADALVALIQAQSLIYTKQKALEARQKEEGSIATDSIVEPLLKAEISSLDSAIQSLDKINATLQNVALIWKSAERHSNHLADPDLANPILIEMMKDKGNDDEFYKTLEEGAKVIDELQRDPPPKKSLDEVAKTMKTGRNVLIDVPKEKGLAKMIKSMASHGIEEEFEKSYLSWLVLAKVNQSMANVLKEASIDVEKTEDDILLIEKDPLTIALHASALGSQK